MQQSIEGATRLTFSEIVKRIRADIKRELPGVTFGIRTKQTRRTPTLNIRVKNVPEEQLVTAVNHLFTIIDRYNYKNSGFYGAVTLEKG